MTDIKPDRTFTVQDPRNFDGDPYQVAERAIQQLNAIVALAIEQMEPVKLMVRNADLERGFATGIASERDWDQSPQGRKLSEVNSELVAIHKTLAALQRAAAYNPKAR